MGYKTQADLDEALRTGTVVDATVTGSDQESAPSTPGSAQAEPGEDITPPAIDFDVAPATVEPLVVDEPVVE